MNNKVKEGRYWTNEDGTTGYQPFTVDNFEDCQHCGRPHGDEVEIVQRTDRAIVSLHPECEAPYWQLWGDGLINRRTEAVDHLGPREPVSFEAGFPSNRTQETEPTGLSADCEEENEI